MSIKKKAAKDQRRKIREGAREARQKLRKETRKAKKDARQEKRETKQQARREAHDIRKNARQDARAIKENAEGGSVSEKIAARQKAQATRKSGREEAREIKQAARIQARVTAREKIGMAKDHRHEAMADIRVDKSAAIQSTRKEWENWLHDLKTDAQCVDSPKNAKQLRLIIQAAVDQGKRLKPVSTGHSHSNATQPAKGHWYVDITQMSGLIDLKNEKMTWAKNADNNVVRVKAGTRLQQLTSQILAPMNLAVANMGSFDGQHVSGVVNTDTHGTGLNLGGFGDMVVSADIFVVVPDEGLKPSVELWRVEPASGQTDPAKADALKGVDRLIQNDDLFYSMVVGYGAFGIAYSYLLQVENFYWLDEVSEISTVKGVHEIWKDARHDKLPALVEDNRHAWVFVNSAWAQVENAKAKKGDPRYFSEIPVRLLKQNKVSARAIPENIAHRLWPPMRRRNDLSEWLGKTCLPKHAKSGKQAGRCIANSINSKFIEDSQPPFFYTGNQSAYYRVLRRTRDNKLSKAKTPGCKWDNTRIDAPPVPPTLALSIDISVPAWQLPRALDSILSEIQAQTVKLQVPMGIRFTAASKHYMAASYGRQSAFLELAGIVENKSERARDLSSYKRAFTAIGKAMRENIPEARPHLGKHHGLAPDDVLRHYPKAYIWLNLQGYLNYSGTWSSPFVTTIGADQHKKTASQTLQWLRQLG